MGFSFYFGPLKKEQHEFNVLALLDFENVVSMSYSLADIFFKLSHVHIECFYLMRAGDVKRADSIIVQVSSKLESLINNLNDELGNEDCQFLSKQFKIALKKGQKLCKKKVLFVESR